MFFKKKTCKDCDRCVADKKLIGSVTLWDGSFKCEVLQIIISNEMQKYFRCNQFKKARKS